MKGKRNTESGCSNRKRKERQENADEILSENAIRIDESSKHVNDEIRLNDNWVEDIYEEKNDGENENDDLNIGNGILDNLLGPGIWENELIPLVADVIRSTICETVEGAKYFSLILDCTPDVNDEERVFLILRCVDVSTGPMTVEEFFIGFLKVVQTSGEALFNELKTVLGTLNLDFNDVRGQSYGYGYGSILKEQYKDVSSRLLKEYPRAFYTSSGCYSLKLALCDMAMSCVEVMMFFGVIRRVFSLFSSSTKRWEILKNYVNGSNGKVFTLKSSSDTRWESRVASVETVRFHAPKIRDALLDLGEHSIDASTTSAAESLVEFEFHGFDFLVGIVVWFEILQKVNKVSKVLQRKEMDVDTAISLLKGLILFFEEYREIGFEIAKVEAEKVAYEMEIEPKFRETRPSHKKKLSDKNDGDEPIQSAEESFRVNFFLKVVDSAIYTLQTRLEHFQEYDNTFGFLFNLSKLRTATDESLKSSCTILGECLKHGDSTDIDADELFSELQIMRKTLPERFTKALEVLEYIKAMHFCFPNAWIAYRIILTIPVTVASAKRSSCKLKLVKDYLRSPINHFISEAE